MICLIGCIIDLKLVNENNQINEIKFKTFEWLSDKEKSWEYFGIIQWKTFVRDINGHKIKYATKVHNCVKNVKTKNL